MRNGTFRTVTAAALAAALVPWCDGCATGFYLKTAPAVTGEAGTGAVEVSVYENGSARDQDALTSRQVRVELVSRDSQPEKVVHAGDAARWTASGLAPGRDLVRVWFPAPKGTAGDTGPSHKRVVVAAGETTTVNVVLKDGAKTALTVAITVTAVVAVTAGTLYLVGWSPLPEHLFATAVW